MEGGPHGKYIKSSLTGHITDQIAQDGQRVVANHRGRRCSVSNLRFEDFTLLSTSNYLLDCSHVCATKYLNDILDGL